MAEKAARGQGDREKKRKGFSELVEPAFRFIREEEVILLTGMSSSGIRRAEAAWEFPFRRRLTANTVAWRSDEIALWMEERPKIEPEPEPEYLADEGEDSLTKKEAVLERNG